VIVATGNPCRISFLLMLFELRSSMEDLTYHCRIHLPSIIQSFKKLKRNEKKKTPSALHPGGEKEMIAIFYGLKCVFFLYY
jgi:hypothetical protein